MTKVRITIDVTYDGDEPDHSTLLDAFQDLPIMEDMLSPDGQEVVEHVVSVETPTKAEPGAIAKALANVVDDYDATGCEESGVISESIYEAAVEALNKSKVNQ